MEGVLMPAATRKADIGSGHACHFPPTAAVDGSPSVFVNDKPVMRVGDPYEAHGCGTCPKPPHGRALAAGSPTVYTNDKATGRIGDAIDCGGSAATGSGDVFLDDSA